MSKELSEYLKKSRERAGVSQNEIVGRMGLAAIQYVCDVESGKLVPSIELIKIYIELCDLDAQFVAFKILEAPERHDIIYEWLK